MKFIKIYLLNCPNTYETQIYCIKHENEEDLISFKEKIFLRCPHLRNSEPHIYWYDLENDKISINCDSDLRFFLVESEMSKIFFDFGCTQGISRKRYLADDEASETSKRIRRQLEEIDLASDDSSMDTSDNENEAVLVANVTSTIEEPVASTSKVIENESPKVKILNIEVIKSSDEVDGSEQSNITNEAQDTSQEETSSTTKDKKRTNSESTNKIVISDSSDDEPEEVPRRHSYSESNNYSSTYSFAGINSERARGSFDDNFRYRHHFRGHHRQNYRNAHAEHIARIFQNAQDIRNNALRNAEAIRSQTMRNIRNSTSNLFPQMLSTFQSHFRPLFHPQNFSSQQQQFFRRH